MRIKLQSRPVFIFFLSPKVEQWFREKREQRQATIDVVDIESEGEEVEEERKDISDDEEKEQVKEQMMKPREAKESESEKKMNRNIGMKKNVLDNNDNYWEQILQENYDQSGGP